MALDATAGGASSNSYNTRLEANAYFQLGNHPKASVWFKIENDTKDEYLIRGTQLIEAQSLRGYKSDTNITSGVPDQALHFPRSSEGDYILDAVKRACNEQAVFLAEASGSDIRSRLQAQGVTSIDIAGDVKETYSGVSSKTSEMLAPVARALLIKAHLIDITARAAS